MLSLKMYLDRSSESHQNPQNQLIHQFCVPLILTSILGVLWTLPTWSLIGNLNWSYVGILAMTSFYLLFVNGKVMLAHVINLLPFFLFINLAVYFSVQKWILPISIGVFVVAWIFQFIGHKIEGKKPSFFTDLFYLLIGPLWVVEHWLRSLGRSLLD